MPVTDLAAKRYAQAAFELSQERSDASQWQAALGQMAEFMTDPEVRAVLENRRVAQDSKQNLVRAALADLPPMALNLARLLVRKDRTPLASDIAIEFRALTEEQRGIVHARASTAVALSDAERGALASRLRERMGREVMLETDVDPSLLGGVVVQIGDRLIDASTRAKLQALRQALGN